MPADRPLESAHEASSLLGTGSARQDVDLVLGAHESVLPQVRAQSAAIADAVDLLVSALSRGGRVLYVGAGTSGWLAALDAAEVVVTFGMAGRVDSAVAGGALLDPIAMTLGDDDVASAAGDPRMTSIGDGDVVIAVSASGRTPYTVVAVERLRGQGASVVAVVSDIATPLAALADVEICVPVSGEVVAGSTRLTAGMAQKVVLNTVSTAAMSRFGRVVSGQMVCVLPLNDKLRARIVAAIARAADVDEGRAAAAMSEAGQGDVAVVSLLAGVSVDAARERLARAFGSIPAAVADAQTP